GGETRAHRRAGTGAPRDVAGAAAVRGAHLGRGRQRHRPGGAADRGAVGLQTPLLGERRGRGGRPGGGRASAPGPGRPAGARPAGVQRRELGADGRDARAGWGGQVAVLGGRGAAHRGSGGRRRAAPGALQSLQGPDGKERVKTSAWGGVNQLVYAKGGAHSALWTWWDRRELGAAAQLAVTQAQLTRATRQKLPGIGVRLVAERKLEGFPAITSTVTLYDDLPWIDIENRLVKTPTGEEEALYVALPVAFRQPTVEVEVPLGRMTVEKDQQPGSCRDWYCHAHWVWLHEGADGVLWSGPDTPLFTLNDLVRGEWRRRIAPDGTLFAYAMNNYWHTNYAARQGGAYSCRLRLSLLAPGDAAEPVRRGWGACDPLYVSAAYQNALPGRLIARDLAL